MLIGGSDGLEQRVNLFGVRLGEWRNGRRARFRSVSWKRGGGSTPPSPTLVETDDEGPAGIHSRGAFLVVRACLPYSRRPSEQDDTATKSGPLSLEFTKLTSNADMGRRPCQSTQDLGIVHPWPDQMPS